MNDTKFQIGDVVTLNSGGPLMTVETEEDSQGFVKCKWFNEKEIKFDFFLSNTIKLQE